jgi:DNA-binding winged helix-turn-helix (wHTH) protein
MIRCGNLQIDIATTDIRDLQGERAKLSPKAVELLVFLAQRANQLVTREQVLAQVWAGRVVEENALDQAIFQARTALGDHERKILVSVPRRGIELRVVAEDAFERIQKASANDDLLASEPTATSTDQHISTKYDREEVEASANASPLAPVPLASVPPRVAKKWRWMVAAFVGISAIAGYALVHQRAKVAAMGTQAAIDLQPAVVVQAGTPEELIAVLQALAATKNAARVVRLGGVVRNTDVELRLAGNARGLLLREKQSTEFYDLEQVREALRALMLGAALGANQLTQTSSAPSSLEALLSAGDNSFPNVRDALITQITQQPSNDRYWNELSALHLLSGRADLAAMLAGPAPAGVDPTMLAPGKGTKTVLQFAEHIRNAKNQPEAVASAAALREICASRAIARYSWISASCALELGLAELKAGEDESSAMSLGYARAAFAKNGDVDSEQLVTSMEHIAFVNANDLDAVDFSKVMQLSDVRAVGLLLRPLIMQKPKAAFQLAEAALSSPAITQDYSSTTSIAGALGLAARRSHELPLKERALGLLENLVQTVPAGELRSSITQSVIYLHLTTGNVGEAIALVDADPNVPEPQLFRCARGNVYVAALRFDEAKADFEHCFSRRTRKSHATLGMGLLAAAGIASTARLTGDIKAAEAALEIGRAEFEASTGNELNWYVAAVGLWQQHVYLGQAQLVADTCARLKGKPKFRGCPEELMFLVEAHLRPEKLAPIQFQDVLRYASDYGEVLVKDLYIEQKRTGKCEVKTPEFDQWVANAKSRKQPLTLKVLNAIRDDCVKGRLAGALKLWPMG